MPERPADTAVSTKSDQFSPAATVIASESAQLTPRLRISSARPGQPASPTSTLLPPPSSNSGSAAWSAAATSATRCSVLSAMTRSSGGPPTPSVVSSASGVGAGPGAWSTGSVNELGDSAYAFYKVGVAEGVRQPEVARRAEGFTRHNGHFGLLQDDFSQFRCVRGGPALDFGS